MKTMRRVLCWMMVAVLVIGAMPATIFATEANTAEATNNREVVSLSGEWEFTEDGETTTVTVPHCWGNGGDSTAKVTKTCTYEKEIDVSAYEGKELFLFFEAVNKTAKVYVDGVLLTTHVGGYYAFTVDITEACKGKETVTVKVEATNSNQETVPLYSDFTYFGGIYRDVWLYAVDPAAYISNEDYGTEGLYVASNVDLDNGSATVDATVMLTNTEEAVVNVEVKDADGNVVGSAEKTVTETGRVQEIKLDTITIENANLWQGTIDPYLYTVEATVTVNGVELDAADTRIGLRTFKIENGDFYLNGEIYEVRGVGMHQDGAGDTYATTDEQKIADLEMIEEMGANAIRTAHYPHDEIVYEWCDEHGFLLWDEIPNFVFMRTDEEFIQNTRNNVIEMVKQGYNYPSIIIWGVANEVNDQSANFGDAAASAEQLNEIINGLADLAEELDPSRMIGEAQIDSTKWAEETASWTTADSTIDVVGFNLYTGWYGNVNGATVENKIDRLVTALQSKLKKFQAMYDQSSGKVSYCLTEYGAGANIEQHDDLGADFLWGGTNPDKGYVSGGNWHPEEYQSYVHEGLFMAIYGDETNNVAPAENLWAGFVWAMFDFSCYRSEGGQVGINDKGLVTQDRQTKKDAYYLYKANWNEDDLFTYITSSRFEARDTKTIDVKVYSNCDSVELIVDGKTYGNGKVEQDGVFVWSGVELKQDETVYVEAIGTKDGEVVYTDTCDTWYYAANAQINSDSDLSKEYDGEPVEEPEYIVKAGKIDVTNDADVTIEWYQVADDNTSSNEEDSASSGGSSNSEDEDYDAANGGQLGTGSSDEKLDGPPSEVGKYYCLITVADGSNDKTSWLGSSLRIDFEIYEAAPEDPTDSGCNADADCPSMAYVDLSALLDTKGPDLWWHVATDYVISNKLMTGMETDVFDLETISTRAMLVMTLWRNEGMPESEETSSYTDVNDDAWYADAIAWATKEGIIEGYGNNVFGPNDPVTREQIATIFYRYADSKGMDVSAEGDLSVFPDAGNISAWALDAMEWAVGTGFLEGFETGLMEPELGTARAQLAMVLMRWCEDSVN